MHTVSILIAHPGDGAERLTSALADTGFRVTTVETATAALARLTQDGYDCLVSVYDLPGDDGLHLFEAVRALDTETPFVLYADVDETVANDAFSAGVDRFVSRDGPEAVSRLVEEVTDLTSPASDLPPRELIEGHEPDPVDVMRAVDEAPIGISLCDPSLPDYPLVYVNDAWEEMTGYDREEVLGRNPRILQGPETDDEATQSVAAAIDNETATTVELRNYRRDGMPFWNELTVAPIHDEDGDLDLYVGFQNDITGRKNTEQLAEERAAKLTEERQALRRVLRRVNGMIHEITRVLVEQENRQPIAQGICDEIASEEGYAGAWFGSLTVTGDELDVEAVAGVPADANSPFPVDRVPNAVSEAVETNDLRLCTVETSDADHLGPLAVGARRFAAVPVSYGQKTYGVLGVYGEGIEALDRREQQLFESIGTMVGSRLNAIETAHILTADTVVEVRVAIDDRSFPLSAVATVLGTDVEYVGLTNATNADTYELFLTAECESHTDEASELDVTAVSELDLVEDARHISATDTAATLAVSLGSGSPFTDLADHGASLTSARVEDGRATLVLALPPEHDIRPVIDVLESRYGGVEMRSRQEREARTQTVNEFASRVDNRLTQRQQAAIEAAHMNGYFEWPRPTDGAEIAETMGITRQTFHQHLRAAERKLIEAYVELCSTRRQLDGERVRKPQQS